MTEIIDLSVAEIMPGNNDRKVFDQAKLKELAASISEHGLAQPITVRIIDTDLYQIVAGERRYRAISEVLNWPTIPAIVRDLSDEQASAIMLAENTGRADLNPIEEANAYRSRIQAYDWTPEQIAKIAGVSAELVKRRIKLLSLNSEIQHLVAHGHFPLGHAETIADLDPNRQNIALRIYRESANGLPLAAFRSITSQLLEEQSQESLFDLENFWVEQVQDLKDFPKRGKRAVTGAPTRMDLPPLQTSGKDSVGSIMDRYIAELVKAGHEAEAQALGLVYNTLVVGNWVSVPNNANLLNS